MIHILVTGFTDNYGGIESFIYNQYRCMDHSKIHIDLLSHNENPAYKEEIMKYGGTIYYITARSKNVIQYKKQLKSFFKNYAKQYDILWCNKCMVNNIDILKQAYKYNIRIRIIHSHNSSNMHIGLQGRIIQRLHDYNKKRLGTYATELWACSDYAANWMFLPELQKKKKVQYIPNAVDTSIFCIDNNVRVRMRKQMKVEEKFVIGHVGRFNYQKNHDFLIEIIRQLYETREDVCLLLVGCGELEETIKEKVHSLKLDSIVLFLGIRHDIPELMQAMDCFVLPSRFEGLPVVAVEAQAAGLPCYLASDGITMQTKITDQAKFLELSKGASYWAKEIFSSSNIRTDTIEQVKIKGFDLKSASKMLQGRFEKLYA